MHSDEFLLLYVHLGEINYSPLGKFPSPGLSSLYGTLGAESPSFPIIDTLFLLPFRREANSESQLRSVERC